MNAQVDSANGQGWKRADWTLRYPELGTGPVSYEDSISPEFFELEREAIFRRRWLNVGHVSEVPRVGSFFTREMEVCRTSIVVVRGKDNVIRAFHNACPHRGNKLVWHENPMKESSGNCRLFRCKYHGWTFDLDGKSHRVSDQEAFFDLDQAGLNLSTVHCSVWKGWIFVNFADKPEDTLEESMGEIGAGLKDYPAERLTAQYKYSGELNCNWKVLFDAFLETYHAAYLHGALRSDIEHGTVLNHTIDFSVDAKGNRRAAYFGSPEGSYRTPVERILNSDMFGPLDAPDFGYKSLQDLPTTLNATRNPSWGLDQITFHPNFQLLVWERNWITVHSFWPLTHDRSRFDTTLCFVPPANARQRIAQERLRITEKDFALQDLNLLPGTYQMLRSRAHKQYHLSDEEFMVRHMHHVIGQEVERYKASLAKQGGRK